MRVLITGASGFIGKNLVAQLEQRGVETTTVSRRARASAASLTDGHTHRILVCPDNLDQVRDLLHNVAPQVVIHLAGSASAPSLADLYQVNTIFGANLLQAAAELPAAPKVLLIGSAAEYGPVPDAELPVRESFHCRPNTPYGVTKLAQTLHGLAAAGNGLPVTVARIFNPIGAGMSTSLALGSFADQISRFGSEGGTLFTGNLEVERDFIDVGEASRLLVELALNVEATGNIVNICTGVGYSLLDLTQRLIAASGLQVQLQYERARVGNSNVRRFVGHPGKLESLGLSVNPPNMDSLLPAMLL
ncbi:NAD-dependent epimerase/dehydratase family protein [Paraburkholderia dilworthii]|uniref:NAD-dependent epimerase/dehydratase family protein n=1 Tax=Paraburkholderia dilworthii TaxID=948106 RepID=A0ABW9DI80_9BURK